MDPETKQDPDLIQHENIIDAVGGGEAGSGSDDDVEVNFALLYPT